MYLNDQELQGSILAPLWFLFNVNEISIVLLLFSKRFADDINIFLNNKISSQAIQTTNADFAKILL